MYWCYLLKHQGKQWTIGLLLVSSVFAAGGCASPDTVPTPTGAFSTGSFFTEQAAPRGLDFAHYNGMSGEWYMAEMMGTGAALFDYDNDGDLDVYLVQGNLLGTGKSGADALFPIEKTLPLSDQLYRNDLVETGTLHFTNVTEAAGVVATGYGMGVAAGDFNNDGYTDLYVTNLGENQMLQNNADGTFTDITASAGAQDDRFSTSAAFVDYDRDGWLDLYVGAYVTFSENNNKACYTTGGTRDYCGPLSFEPHADRLFRNRGDGTFEDVSAFAQIVQEYGGTLGVIAADFNEDGWPDLYVANDGMANQLWINQQNGRFVNAGLMNGVAFNENGKAEGSMGVDAADFDGDGDEDLFMTHIREETNTLYRNMGGGVFEDATFKARLGAPSRGFTGFGTAWLDYDNDGHLDLLVANGAVRVIASLDGSGDLFPLHQPNQLYHNLGDGRFEETTAQAGEVFTLSEVSRGAAFGDLDNDGDTDVLIVNNNGPVHLLLNEIGNQRAWFGVRMVAASGGRDAYGARVAITLADGTTRWRRVRADASYCSSNDPRILFGLGTAQQIQTIEVYWPDATREVWEGSTYPLGQYNTLVKGTGKTSS